MKKVKVLVIDDSALVRSILAHGLSIDDEIEVIGTATDPYSAREIITQEKPDVLTLDVEMPKMDGLAFLKKLMPQYPLPVVMVSSLTEKGSHITLDALTAGAIDFVCKPSNNINLRLDEMLVELREKVKYAAKVDVSKYRNNEYGKTHHSLNKVESLEKTNNKIIAIGASTGGTEAIRRIITALPAMTPGIVIVQHMPERFTKMFADRLNELSELEVREARNGDKISNGLVLIAPGAYHLQLIRSGGEYQVLVRNGEKVCGHKPSVDVLFRSVARYAGANALGIILTGMGRDGANAMLKLRESGARTIAQDEKSCVVYGMPKEAFELGGVESLVPLDMIPQKIKKILEEMD